VKRNPGAARAGEIDLVTSGNGAPGDADALVTFFAFGDLSSHGPAPGLLFARLAHHADRHAVRGYIALCVVWGT